MKKTILLLAIPAALLFAAGQPDKKTTAKKSTSAASAKATTATTAPAAAPAATPAAAPALPQGAVQISPYSWRYTDTQGKKWIYRQTPFGLVKMDDKPEEAPVSDKNPTIATDQGDSVKFERNTPFGKQNWTKKKTELTDEEKALLDKPAEKE